jgi:hypothetical protein
MKAKFFSHGFLFLFAFLAFATSDAAAGRPDESLNVKLAARIRTWDEAVPPPCMRCYSRTGVTRFTFSRLSRDAGTTWRLKICEPKPAPGFSAPRD